MILAASAQPPAEAAGREVLAVRGLTTEFATPRGVARAVEDVSFTLREGETLCIVGESGSGKSVTALSIMRLVASPPGRIVGGTVLLGGRDLFQLSNRQMTEVRGNEVSMIFQEPMTSLNPVLTVGYQIKEAVRRHQRLPRAEAWRRAVEMLALVRIPEPARRAREYPHQLSGGMRQRAMIAMALACDPKVLIADEPTTALDVTIQAQVLDLIRQLRERLGTAVVLITHDLGVVAETADRVIVMYAGRKVEEAPVLELFARPRHPYTLGLLRSMPRLGASVEASGGEADRLAEIKGIVPPLTDLPAGCPFAPRCSFAEEVCRERFPDFRPVGPDHRAACWNSEKLAGAAS